ncbi:2-oxo-4-hydroxy-4-carboxy-5-ureidoimidazoline decarboxylase [Sneathiella sp. CAU 1612]|uniref:2-oxo-4-hydroxy-4-carboxy-5-ureidoimidazoline decarboxylase n=2 Tax=Sneathiella sedimenti TaxID=2816034 RepID=A0ABS3F6K5_9PROT|nr:2-oxo-4-hydroxy-4-carboxy-5-ureidoimidazoline decarboxylase [Sneathiella sedimenti]MBO0334158.1 2-oxo-4-hydroxy-4-carboxy-5-ureidoimidazoline decarboxylase [Sneathiella sedimenti]
MNSVQFIGKFGGVYEHSPWVAERAWVHGITEKHDEIEELADLMARIVADADELEKHTLIKAHPDLAGKAAVKGELTAASTSEQAGAGLDNCTAEEFAIFQDYNAAYKKKFGFPFIMAVKNSDRRKILAGFEARLQNSVEEEFATALAEIDKIARFRLAEL